MNRKQWRYKFEGILRRIDLFIIRRSVRKIRKFCYKMLSYTKNWNKNYVNILWIIIVLILWTDPIIFKNRLISISLVLLISIIYKIIYQKVRHFIFKTEKWEYLWKSKLGKVFQWWVLHTNIVYVYSKIQTKIYLYLRKVRLKLLKRNYYYRIFIFLEKWVGFVILLPIDIILIIIEDIWWKIKGYILRTKISELIEGRILALLIIVLLKGIFILKWYIIYKIIILWYNRLAIYIAHDNIDRFFCLKYNKMSHLISKWSTVDKNIFYHAVLKMWVRKDDFIYYNYKSRKYIDIHGGYYFSSYDFLNGDEWFQEYLRIMVCLTYLIAKDKSNKESHKQNYEDIKKELKELLKFIKSKVDLVKIYEGDIYYDYGSETYDGDYSDSSFVFMFNPCPLSASIKGLKYFSKKEFKWEYLREKSMKEYFEELYQVREILKIIAEKSKLYLEKQWYDLNGEKFVGSYELFWSDYKSFEVKKGEYNGQEDLDHVLAIYSWIIMLPEEEINKRIEKWKICKMC